MFASLGAFADTLRLEDGLGEGAVRRLLVALVIGLVGAALSGVLLMQYHGEPTAVSAVNQACGDGQTSGCEEVARSPYSRVAGVPLAALGLLFYLSLAVLAALAALAPAHSRTRAHPDRGLDGRAPVLQGPGQAPAGDPRRPAEAGEILRGQGRQGVRAGAGPVSRHEGRAVPGPGQRPDPGGR